MMNTNKNKRKSVLVAISDTYDMEPHAFEQTLRNTVVPAQCTKEQFTAFLMVAKEYKLNPLIKEIYAFPTRGGGIQPIVGVDGWLNLMNSHPQMNGILFKDNKDEEGVITSITCLIYRKDREYPVELTEYLEECQGDLKDKYGNLTPWGRWPVRMLRHKATIQCIRYAFGFAGIVDPDEFERMNDDGTVIKNVTPGQSSAPSAPAEEKTNPHTPPPVTDETVIEGEVVDETEITSADQEEEHPVEKEKTTIIDQPDTKEPVDDVQNVEEGPSEPPSDKQEDVLEAKANKSTVLFESFCSEIEAPMTSNDLQHFLKEWTKILEDGLTEGDLAKARKLSHDRLAEIKASQ